MIHISIGIPAYNEEKNIGLLLSDIVQQYKGKGYCIDEVIVTSDQSNDATDRIVQTFARVYPFITYIRNKKRIGKSYSLNNIIRHVHGEVLVLLDADVRLGADTIFHLIAPFQKKKYMLIAGNPVPQFPVNFWNIAQKVTLFHWRMLDRIKTLYPKSVYVAHGRMLALHKNLYTKINFQKLTTPGDDQYIYLVNKEHHGLSSFFYATQAVVYYKLPTDLHDHIKQSVRFHLAKRHKSLLYSKETIRKEFSLGFQWLRLLPVFFSHPGEALCWGMTYGVSALLYYFFDTKNSSMKKTSAWSIAASTK